MRYLFEKQAVKWCIVIAAAGFVLISVLSNSIARMKEPIPEETAKYKSAKIGVVCTANTQQRVHRVNKAAFCVTNWGFFGSEAERQYESPDGCFKPDPESSTEPAESFMYPIGSQLEYLFQGGLWIGAIVPGTDEFDKYKLDTLVSLACDGWQAINELFPDGPPPAGAIIEKTKWSTVPNAQYIDACTSSAAISEQDIISEYDDRITGCQGQTPDPFDKRPHKPFGVRVTQKSYAWSYSYAEDFFLIDFWIKNVNANRDTIKDIFIGIYIDADVGHTTVSEGGSQDDIAGFLSIYPNPVDPSKIDTIATAWIADNDGDPTGGVFTYKSPTSVTGVRVVRRPPAPPGSESLPDSLKFMTSFNWWISNTSGGALDWGPWLQKNVYKWQALQAYGNSSTTFPDNVRGTPGGDISKYFIMSNREWDYDQVYSNIDRSDSGWNFPSDVNLSDIAKGIDTRYLFSFGPIYSIAPGESVPVTIGYIGGENFHSKPSNGGNLPGNPKAFEDGLDFSDFANNSQWASSVYDNPGVDTDGDGYKGDPIKNAAGDTIGWTGDSVPDFKGPPPPPSPELSFTVKQGEVTISWNGKGTELNKDSFTGKKDFEGYRIYMAKAEVGAEYSKIHSADRIDFQLWKFNPVIAKPQFQYKFPSTPPESLQSWFWPGDTLEQALDSIGAHTDSVIAWTYAGSAKTITVGASGDEKLEIKSGDKFFFRLQDWNRGFAGIAKYPLYRDSVNNGWVTDTLDKYWDYEYTVSGLLPSRQMSFAVTAFDYGNPSTNLDPLESGRAINETKVYPLATAQEVKAKGKKVVIYPNPYRIDGGYADLGFEDPDRSGFREEADRRLWFVNLPSYCKIRIYTLDGDLVREIEHDGRGLVNPTIDYWNLISRNTQAVVSGIYLFSVEDLETGQNQIGKFVIIK